MVENNLTQEDLSILENLKDPDLLENKSNNHYSFDEDMQREILSLIINDKYFLTQSVGIIKNTYFTNQCHQLVCKILYKYFEEYKLLPSKTIVLNELKSSIKDKEDHIKTFYIGEFNTVYKYYLPNIESREYYLDKITNFAKGMAVKNAFAKCLEEFSKAPEEEETWVKIENLIKKALSVNRNFDSGLDYFQSFEERYERMKLKKELGDYFVTGFKSIDESLAGGGLGRGEIGSVIGLPGTGKSIFLVNSAVANIHRGKKVLYISLELSDDKCAERFDAQFANPNPYGSDSNGICTKNLYENKELVFQSLKDYVEDKDDKKLLKIKQFPSGQMGMVELRAYYAQLLMDGFQPDLVLIDYLGEMKDYPGMPTHESRPKIVRDLRGFAVENNVCVLTAMQVDGKSRESIKMGGIIDDDNLAEAKGQNRPLDALWSINQLQEERDCSLARIFVIKHRDGKARFTCHIEFDYNTLKMREISQNKYTTTFNRYKNEKQISVVEHQSKMDELEKIIGGKNNQKTKAAVAAFVDDAGYNDVEDAPFET